MAVKGPEDDIVISSRARIARNLKGLQFPGYAPEETLNTVAELIDSAVKDISELKACSKIVISLLPTLERCCLRESRLISKEFEEGRGARVLYLSNDRNTSIMINEEDHIRMQAILTGFQLELVLSMIRDVDKKIGSKVCYAFSDRFGYLTSCPTNLGTGLRLSLLLHLPALTMLGESESIFSLVSPYGMTIRGINGENTDNIGDLYQLSNEVTMGKSEDDILFQLIEIYKQVSKREKRSREILLTDKKGETEDKVWRNFGILTNARRINSAEALDLLSIMRFGIDLGFFKGIDHHFLNQLITKIQPGHIQWEYSEIKDMDTRDKVRAELLRGVFQGSSINN